MSQASRSSVSSAGLSDDPIENVTAWFQFNQKLILVVLGVVAVSAAAILGYRWMDANKRQDASNALYRATAPLQAGRLPEAQTELEKVVRRFGGTPSGSQAAMLLSQAYFDQKKYPEGIAVLEKAMASASNAFEASFEALIAVGFESQGKYEVAAEHYGKAAAVSKFPIDKGANHANQARNLTAAGKVVEARKIWEELAKNEELPFAQEAQVRLGELVGMNK